VKGRKRHILVDTMGLLIQICVHAADIQERDGARLLLQAPAQVPAQAPVRAVSTSWQLMWADSGYRGEPFAQWVQENCGCRLEIVKKDSQQQGFAILPKRWIVERTFAWLGKCRRLSKDYEQNTQSSEAWIRLCMIHLMLKRL
jgi:putative transposase